MLVAGGGLGGVAAALAAADRGASVVLSEETDYWLGGQLTSQAVPLDEHPWIEELWAAPRRYRALREAIRAHYRAHAPLTAAAPARPDLNPGAATVSRLSCEPRAALAVGRRAGRASADRGPARARARSPRTSTATGSAP